MKRAYKFSIPLGVLHTSGEPVTPNSESLMSSKQRTAAAFTLKDSSIVKMLVKLLRGVKACQSFLYGIYLWRNHKRLHSLAGKINY